MDELTKTLNLLALAAVQSMKTDQQIDLMSKAGYTAPEIATLLGTTPNAVYLRVSKMKKKGKGQGVITSRRCSA